MKKFDGLTTVQRESAIRRAFHDLVENISNGILEIELVDQKNQSNLVSILHRAAAKDSPRLATLGILNDKGIRKEIERLALVVAHGSDYNEDGSPLTKGKENETH